MPITQRGAIVGLETFRPPARSSLGEETASACWPSQCHIRTACRGTWSSEL
uniref:60S ribosomal protein L38 n=1 Tax=Arundo donax TaxID=35708 RepID=A0A0A9D2N8_ARUDO